MIAVLTCMYYPRYFARVAREEKIGLDIFWMSGHSRFAVPDTPPLFRPDGRKIIKSRTCIGQQVLQYLPGTNYGVHTDCTNQTGSDDRIGTLLLYLSDLGESQGGETCFPRRGTCVRPRKGSALIFSSLDAAGGCDILSEHEAREVQPGADKVVLQRWYRRDPQITGAGPNHLQELLDTEVDKVICDRGQNCRHYLYDPRRMQALRLAIARARAWRRAGRCRRQSTRGTSRCSWSPPSQRCVPDWRRPFLTTDDMRRRFPTCYPLSPPAPAPSPRVSTFPAYPSSGLAGSTRAWPSCARSPLARPP